VDVPEELFEPETAFWSGALGSQAETDPDDPDYSDLGEVTPGMRFMVQRVGAAPRVHLDIETDDVEAEASRLEGLGAERVAKIHTWWVMRDPAGLLFCVVRVQLPEVFDRSAKSWP
jgi:hypothetical protein